MYGTALLWRKERVDTARLPCSYSAQQRRAGPPWGNPGVYHSLSGIPESLSKGIVQIRHLRASISQRTSIGVGTLPRCYFWGRLVILRRGVRRIWHSPQCEGGCILSPYQGPVDEHRWCSHLVGRFRVIRRLWYPESWVPKPIDCARSAHQFYWFLTLDPPSFWYSFNFLTDQHSWWTSVSSVEAGAFECVCPSFVWKYNSKNGSKSQSWSTFSVSPFQILTVAIFTLFLP